MGQRITAWELAFRQRVGDVCILPGATKWDSPAFIIDRYGYGVGFCEGAPGPLTRPR